MPELVTRAESSRLGTAAGYRLYLGLSQRKGDISGETLCFSPATWSSCGLDGLLDLIIRQAVSGRAFVPDLTWAEGRDNGRALHTSG